MNHEFMEYMSVSYPDTPLSEFKVSDTLISLPGLTFNRIKGHGIVDRIQGHGTPEGLHLDDFITAE
jgi:hypothetical protein